VQGCDPVPNQSIPPQAAFYRITPYWFYGHELKSCHLPEARTD